MQHELNPVRLTAVPSGLRGQNSKTAFLGGCVAPVGKVVDLEPAVLFWHREHWCVQVGLSNACL